MSGSSAPPPATSIPAPAKVPAPSKPPGSLGSVWSKWGDLATKVFTVLLVPVTVLVVGFYVRVSLAEERIARLQSQCEGYERQLSDLDRRLDAMSAVASETNAQIREVRVLVETIRESIRHTRTVE